MDKERRTSVRCAVQSDEEAAILRTERSDFMVRLVEKSAGGYGLVIERDLDLEVGQTVSLATSGGCCEAKVVHVAHDGEETRLGLQNIRDLSHLPGGSNWLTRKLAVAWKSKYARIQLAIVLLLGLGVFIWGSTLPKEDDSAAASTPVSNTSLEAAKRKNRKLALDHLRLGGLTKGNVITDLDLTPKQRTEIDGILSETAAAMAIVYDEQSDGNEDQALADVALQLVFFAGRQIEEVLTEQQRSRWAAVVEESALQAWPADADEEKADKQKPGS